MTDQKPPESGLSPVFAHGEAAKPRVRAPDSPMTVWVGLIGAGILGFVVFNGLSGARQAHAQTEQPAPTPPPSRPLTPLMTPPQPAPIAPAPAPMVQQSVAPPTDPSEAHWRAPAMVVDYSTPPDGAQAVQLAQATPGAQLPGAAGVPAATDARASADERFAARIAGTSGSDTARASQMRDLGRTVPQGAVIAAVLETAINSDLPGSVRAVVSRDVRSFDGSRVLIPRGSKLVGQYKSAAAIGQTRAFVVWSRIISPTGITIDVGSPATDRLGRGGLDGEVDTHFFRRFGASILLSVVSAGSQALANSATGSNGNTTLVIGSPAQATQVADAALQQQINIPDTIKVAQGAPVQVFVARDLDFSAVAR
jgi:type IV secretion system protein VirB10